MIWMLAAAALAGRWDDEPTNIEATVHTDASVEDVMPLFTDLATLEQYPEDCISELTLGEPSSGYGARFRVRYHAGPWTRLVEGHIADVGHQHVDLEHEGRYGFTTRLQVSRDDEQGGSTIAMTTFLDPPPWPFKKAFYTRVRPAWAACHAALVESISASAGDRAE